MVADAKFSSATNKNAAAGKMQSAPGRFFAANTLPVTVISFPAIFRWLPVTVRGHLAMFKAHLVTAISHPATFNAFPIAVISHLAMFKGLPVTEI